MDETPVANDVRVTNTMPLDPAPYVVRVGEHACARCAYDGPYEVDGPNIAAYEFELRYDADRVAALGNAAYCAGFAAGRREPLEHTTGATAAALLLRQQLEKLDTAIHNFAIANDMRSPLGVRLMDEAARAARLLVEVA